jgi:hypothetical protein
MFRKSYFILLTVLIFCFGNLFVYSQENIFASKQAISNLLLNHQNFSNSVITTNQFSQSNLQTIPTHTLSATYYNLNDDFDSVLMISNQREFEIRKK